MFICGGGDFLIMIHLVPFVTDYGVSPTSAANMLALSGLMSLGGILISGPASDLIGNKIPISALFVLRLLLFLMQGVAPRGTTLGQVAWAATPYLACDALMLVLLIAVPGIAMYLPGLV